MRTVIGGTLLTLGCLIGLGALLSVAWAADWRNDRHSPGAGGFQSFVAFALFGWAGLAFLLGIGTLRNKGHAVPGQLLILAAAVAGTLIGCGTYFLYEMRLGKPQLFELPDGAQVDLRVRGFGTIFELNGGSRVEWRGEDGARRGGMSEGAEAKAILCVVGVSSAYGLAGGFFVGTLAWFGFGRPRPAEAVDYDDKMRQIQKNRRPIA